MLVKGAPGMLFTDFAGLYRRVDGKKWLLFRFSQRPMNSLVTMIQADLLNPTEKLQHVNNKPWYRFFEYVTDIRTWMSNYIKIFYALK